MANINPDSSEACFKTMLKKAIQRGMHVVAQYALIEHMELSLYRYIINDIT